MLTTVAMRRALLSLTGALLLLLGLLWRSNAWATPPPSEPTQATIIFQTVPPANATVFWGKTRLGRIKPQQPLVVVRPRDSGPLDVVIRAPGFLPVQTRAHTFGDTRLAVKLTRVDQKSTLFGYRVPLDDAGVPLVTDGGAPDALSGMPSSATTPAPAQ